jgi:hypothetical protein
MEQKNMNMISTGTFQTEVDASNKQESISQKFVRVWERKNAKAARAGGVSLMALSLAACGSDDSTATSTSTTTTTTTTTTTAASQSLALTIGADTLTGGAGDDSIAGGRIDSIITLNAADVIDGGAGTDTLTARTVNGLATSSISNVENLVITDTGTGGDSIVFSTATATYISGVTSITNLSSTNAMTFARVSELASITVNNTATLNTIVQFADSVLAGATDTVTLNLTGVTGASTIRIGTSSDTDGGMETLNIVSTGAASDLGTGQVDAATATTVNVTASVATDLGSAVGLTGVTTFNAADSTAGVTAVFDDFDVADSNATAVTTAKTITGGAGADNFDISAMENADIGVVTISGGAGNDTVSLGAVAFADLAITGGAGTDILKSTAVLTAAGSQGLSGFETLDLTVAGSGTQDMAVVNDSNSYTKLVLRDAITITNAKDAIATVSMTDNGVMSFDRLVDSTTNSVTLAAGADLASATTVTDVFADEETITIDASSFDFERDGNITTTDLTSLVLTGDNTIQLGTSGSKTLSATKLATVDGSAVTGTEAVTVVATASTVAMTVTGPGTTGAFTVNTGSGADTITAGSGAMTTNTGGGDDTVVGGAKVDTVVGGAGNDNITGNGGLDVLTGGNGVDTITLTETTAKQDTVHLSNGANNYDIIIGFDAGGTATDDNLNAADGTYTWFGDGVANNDGAVALQTGATLAAAHAIDDNATVYTISTNLAANTLDNYMAGSITEANLETAVITAVGATTGLTGTDIVMVFVDDGEHTAMLKFDGDTTSTGNATAAELEIMAILKDFTDATAILAADVTMA